MGMIYALLNDVNPHDLHTLYKPLLSTFNKKYINPPHVNIARLHYNRGRIYVMGCPYNQVKLM